MLKSDFKTNSHTQWFYFKISNTRKNIPYTFRIINMGKPDSLYNHGMRILSYSLKDAEVNKIGWKRWGESISYVKSTYKREESKTYYMLTFTVTFNFNHDSVYFANCFPYTYSDLKYMLNECWSDKTYDKIRRTSLTKTLAGNDIDVVIITNFSSSQKEISIRKWVVLTGRVHPGESNSSFVVDGIIRFLISNEDVAVKLRNIFVFKIVPMLNPDGVIIGNHRWSLAGWDLNRQWKTPNYKKHPEIYCVKEMIRKTVKWRGLFWYVDFHGHSQKKNVFMFGWSDKNIVGSDNYAERAIPFMFSYHNDSFSYKDWSFIVQKAREGTARYVVHNEFNVINSYTLEVSLFGPLNGTFWDWHFTPNHLRDIGK